MAISSASSQRVLKPSCLTNIKTGQMLLGKGMKGSLTVLGATPPQAAGISQPGTDNEMDFPPLTADS